MVQSATMEPVEFGAKRRRTRRIKIDAPELYQLEGGKHGGCGESSGTEQSARKADPCVNAEDARGGVWGVG